MFGSKNGVLWEMCKWRTNFCASANLTCGGGGDSFIWPKRISSCPCVIPARLDEKADRLEATVEICNVVQSGLTEVFVWQLINSNGASLAVLCLKRSESQEAFRGWLGITIDSYGDRFYSLEVMAVIDRWFHKSRIPLLIMGLLMKLHFNRTGMMEILRLLYKGIFGSIAVLAFLGNLLLCFNDFKYKKNSQLLLKKFPRKS
ncbi:unnamed protein product [Porites lobata]|uniref:Uncharacterized protein n=1 Tax=Porites lobata TaxID=104759 RepID=A0ABN8QNT2_9CNID|nr:unnamed protein product [Porites lobata]